MKVTNTDRPMKSVMTIGEYEGSIMYRAACDCGSEEHDMTMDIEFDNECGLTILTFYKKVSFDPYWFGGSHETKWSLFKGRVEEWWKRIKAAARILTGNYLNHEASFLMYGEEQIDHFIKALEYGKIKSRDYQEELKKKGITQISG